MSKQSRSNQVAELLDKLQELGYYKYAKPINIRYLKEEALEQRHIFGWEASGRVYNADSEDLAEGYTWWFIEELTPFLEQLGVHISDISHTFDNDIDHTVTVNGRTHTICTLQEEDELGLELWQVGTNRAFTIINDLLAEAGSDERVYQLYEGNDCHAIFLTAELYEAIITSDVLPPKLLPRPVPVDRGPNRDNVEKD